MIPKAAPSEARLSTTALSGRKDGPERSHQEDEREQNDEGQDEREVAVDGADEVAALRLDAAEGQRRGPPELMPERWKNVVLES